ncbi:MAG TPA: YicC/YloC family endoribonuclease [Bryobacteraceae bacterium]|nr:YicC/YloC family endoribonuclease [Bryobacteraceae bacterium]
MSVRSMTGFSRVTKNLPAGEVVLSIKSVNHRGLDLHFHVPPELEALESDLRGIIKERVVRGHLQIHLAVVRTAETGASVLNRPLLDAYLRAFREAAGLLQAEGRPDVSAALAIPGMLGTPGREEIDDCVADAARDLARAAVTLLNEFREREGAATAAEIRQRTQQIYGLVERMQDIRAGALPAFQKRLRDKLAELLQGTQVDPQRIAQEAAILADRSDISEELSRLRTHAEHLDQMIVKGGEVGKRLDFLLQEMNRESNTVLSKTGGLGELGLTITELALAAKSEIDKIREQSLNLE